MCARDVEATCAPVTSPSCYCYSEQLRVCRVSFTVWLCCSSCNIYRQACQTKARQIHMPGRGRQDDTMTTQPRSIVRIFPSRTTFSRSFFQLHKETATR